MLEPKKNPQFIHGTFSIKSGKANIPKIMKQSFRETQIGFILNSRCVLLCDKDVSAEVILECLEALRKHIELKMR